MIEDALMVLLAVTAILAMVLLIRDIFNTPPNCE